AVQLHGCACCNLEQTRADQVGAVAATKDEGALLDIDYAAVCEADIVKRGGSQAGDFAQGAGVLEKDGGVIVENPGTNAQGAVVLDFEDCAGLVHDRGMAGGRIPIIAAEHALAAPL